MSEPASQRKVGHADLTMLTHEHEA